MSEIPAAENQAADIVARAGRYYRNARYLITTLALGAGLWFGYDGFYNYPKYTREFNEAPPARRVNMKNPETETGILIQKIISITLISFTPAFVAFFLYRSRGEYRLLGNTLHVPGHPPIPLGAIDSIDKTLWDRKGIAVKLVYQVGDSEKTAKVTLDDFIYDQKPIDRIVERIEAHLTPAGEPEADPRAPSRQRMKCRAAITRRGRSSSAASGRPRFYSRDSFPGSRFPTRLLRRNSHAILSAVPIMTV